MWWCSVCVSLHQVWLPAQQTYREISSCSNCGDFQVCLHAKPAPTPLPSCFFLLP